eukprot:80263-Chlamydomonas_euryale.AAC.2
MPARAALGCIGQIAPRSARRRRRAHEQASARAWAGVGAHMGRRRRTHGQVQSGAWAGVRALARDELSIRRTGSQAALSAVLPKATKLHFQLSGFDLAAITELAVRIESDHLFSCPGWRAEQMAVRLLGKCLMARLPCQGQPGDHSSATWRRTSMQESRVQPRASA